MTSASIGGISVPIRICRRSVASTHSLLVENFMVAANGAVARTLGTWGVCSKIRRVVKTPAHVRPPVKTRHTFNPL